MIAWTIAGVDSGGGAGIAADLRTFAGLGVHGCPVVCAVTAQNSVAITGIEYTSADMVRAQIQALASDLRPKAVKIGMIGNGPNIEAVAAELAKIQVTVVCDPVLVSSSGTALLEEAALQLLVARLLPRVDLLTPNLPELAALTGMETNSSQAIEAAARRLCALGPKAVLIKGGHGDGPWSQDYFWDGSQGFWLTSPRLASAQGHGTGCTLASAIAALLARGEALVDAVVIAKAYLNQGLSQAKALGQGPGPVHQGAVPHEERFLPWLTGTAEAGGERPYFPTMNKEWLGFYPIVDSVEWLRRLLPLGVSVAQLRLKDLCGAALADAVAEGIQLAREYDCRLFINDHWALAIEHGAYGVHLGQEDLPLADVSALAGAGVRLGVSTHGAAEVARALALRPSYIAMGPIFATGTKVVTASPRGLERLAYWCQLLTAPVVAIGGIHLGNLDGVLTAGARGVAVISAITAASNPEAAALCWLERCRV